LLPKGAKGWDVPDDVLRVGERDDRYIQLRPQEPEQALLRAIQPPSSREAAQTLAHIVEEYPDYLAALQQLGRILNDLGDCRGALGVLDRARARNPRSARTLCEIGRARFRLNDIDGGRKEIEAALESNPMFYPGWQYLLRLLSLFKNPDGPRWARRAREVHPYSYVLALAGASVYEGLAAVEEVGSLLELYGTALTPQEKPAAAAAFSEALREVAGSRLDTPEGLALLRRCCKVFPESARLWDMLGRALRLAGKYDESNEVFTRALAVRRAATTYQTEFAKPEGTIHYWEFGEHILKWMKKHVE
jgi:tetratricopeptide (TPR) repeat protein